MMDINTGKQLTGEKAFNQSIKLILLTQKGDRVLNRNFGSKMVQFLGQPINMVAMEIYGETVKSLEENNRRIKVEKVNIKNQNDAGLDIEIIYNGEEKSNVTI